MIDVQYMFSRILLHFNIFTLFLIIWKCMCVYVSACMALPKSLSQQFNNFLRSWKISHTTGIPCNSQGQTIEERISRALKELLDRTISPEARRDPYLSLTFSIWTFSVLMTRGSTRPTSTGGLCQGIHPCPWWDGGVLFPSSGSCQPSANLWAKDMLVFFLKLSWHQYWSL